MGTPAHPTNPRLVRRFLNPDEQTTRSGHVRRTKISDHEPSQVGLSWGELVRIGGVGPFPGTAGVDDPSRALRRAESWEAASVTATEEHDRRRQGPHRIDRSEFVISD